MFDEKEGKVSGSAGTPRWVGLAVAVLGGVSLIALGTAWNATQQAKTVEQESKAAQAAVKQSNDAVVQRVAKAEDENRSLRNDLKVVTDKLNVTQSELVSSRRQTKSISSDYDQKLTGLQSSVNSELAKKAGTEEITRLNGDVSGVKSEIEEAKKSLEMAKSELGTLIARNHDEVEVLRRMGQREYIEFTISRKGGAQKVGAVQIELKSSNPRKNQFTITVLADDTSFEKKNRSVNEPIFFYTRDSKVTLELVINKLTQTQASGYLSMPKAMAPSSGTAVTSGK
ncbi:MAG: hypothetical protein LAN71_15195 [Acidobacteriia bacterium]|nr:hypothetical protein [Terriglobia bacterium]